MIQAVILENLSHYVTRNDHLVLGLSGGVDSVVLGEILFLAGFKNINVAHFNHQLRGAESDQDQKFCQKLSHKWGYSFHSDNWLNPEKSEARARSARYQFLEQILEVTNSKYIILAHHQDDLIETIIFNFLRGTGIKGLKGFRFLNQELKLLRPLVNFPKSAICDFAQENNLSYREDSTNKDLSYSRNFLRHQVIPLIKTNFPQLNQVLQRNSDLLTNLNNYLEKQVAKKIKTLKVKEYPGFYDLLNFQKLDNFLQLTIIKELFQPVDLSQENILEIQKFLLTGQSGKHKAYGKTIIKIMSNSFYLEKNSKI